MNKEKTPLEIIQDQIDECNQRRGCDSMCSKKEQKECYKLISHAERIKYCRKCGLPVIYW